MALQDEISKITLDVMMGIRKGVGECRTVEFSEYLKDLIKAKEGGIDVSTLISPMLSDRVRQGVEAALVSKTNLGVEGGATWNMIGISGKYDRETDRAVKVNVDMEFMTAGMPDFSVIDNMSVAELNSLIGIIDGNPSDNSSEE